MGKRNNNTVFYVIIGVFSLGIIGGLVWWFLLRRRNNQSATVNDFVNDVVGGVNSVVAPPPAVVRPTITEQQARQLADNLYSLINREHVNQPAIVALFNNVELTYETMRLINRVFGQRTMLELVHERWRGLGGGSGFIGGLLPWSSSRTFSFDIFWRSVPLGNARSVLSRFSVLS